MLKCVFSSVFRLSPRPLRVSSTVWFTDGRVDFSAEPEGRLYLETWTLRRLWCDHRRQETTRLCAPQAERERETERKRERETERERDRKRERESAGVICSKDIKTLRGETPGVRLCRGPRLPPLILNQWGEKKGRRRRKGSLRQEEERKRKQDLKERLGFIHTGGSGCKHGHTPPAGLTV